jgi:hypothetical protein
MVEPSKLSRNVFLSTVEITLKQLAIARGSSRSDAFVLRAVSDYPRSRRPAPRSD